MQREERMGSEAELEAELELEVELGTIAFVVKC